MALKKSIAGYWRPVNKIVTNDDGTVSHINGSEWVEPRHVDMHPLEEASILADWAIHDVKSKVPSKPNKDEEHEWLIEHGAEYVKQKRKEWQSAYDAALPSIEAAEKAFQDAHGEWVKHAERAKANGFDPDTAPDSRELPMPEEIKDATS